MKLQFHLSSSHAAAELRKPYPCDLPRLESASVAALYRAARMGGDFYDFETIGKRLVFFLIDIAGARAEAMSIAAAVQESFHQNVVQMFGPDANEADALSALLVLLNRKLLAAAGGVRCSPGFFGCYDEELGMLFYINAGHVPALIRDHDGVRLLESGGVPLGLFTHATQDAMVCVLDPSAALLLVSKGLLETRARGQEFGIERLRQNVLNSSFTNASELCSGVLTAVQQYSGGKPPDNDVTAVALMRAPVAAAVAIG